MIQKAVKTLIVLSIAALSAQIVAAQANVAVIDIQRVVTESDAGKEALGKLKQLQDEKIAEGQKIQTEADSLREQLTKQRFTLTDEKIAELNKQLEDKGTELRRFQEDAQRELDDARRTALGGLEERILPVIDEVGREKGLTLIFNKFQSGLVFADEEVDITDEVIRRFNLTE